MRIPAFFFLFSALSASAFAFQQQQPPQRWMSPSAKTRSPLFQPGSSSSSANSKMSPLFSAHFASESEVAESSTVSFPRMVRNSLRDATGFSFTVFRATLRGITGISLSALYASCLAASGLWVRKTMSVLLSVFPSGFRYFLQPFLVLYYTPLIILKGLTSPTTRKRAVKKHETVLEAWKGAVVMAEQTEKDGYWPVVVNDDGYFELSKPPSVGEPKMADAMAETVEQAMEVNSETDGKK